MDGTPEARFRVTDGTAASTVSYDGILPDLFREGQGMVALGTLQPDGTFRASEVLAKHDETYMPRRRGAEALNEVRPLGTAGRDLGTTARQASRIDSWMICIA